MKVMDSSYRSLFIQIYKKLEKYSVKKDFNELQETLESYLIFVTFCFELKLAIKIHFLVSQHRKFSICFLFPVTSSMLTKDHSSNVTSKFYFVM